MDKEDYQKIGDILAKYKASLDMINDFAKIFEKSMDNFSRDKFIEYIRNKMKVQQ